MDAQKLANHAEGLFSLPEVSNRLATLLEDESFVLPEIAELISYDPVLLGRLLTTANQAPYQGPEVDNVSEAVARIGLKDLRTLVISTKAVQTFGDLPPDLVDMNNFWHHSVCTGLAAESLAFKCEATEPTQLFVGGLMHDIGQLLIYQLFPDLSRQVLEKASESEYYRYRAEKEILGEEMTHAHVGAALMRKWNLSPVLQEMVAFHHEPRRAVNYPLEVSIVHISTAIASCMEPSWGRGQQDISGLNVDGFAWETTGLSPKVVEPIADQINMESFTVLDIIDPDSLKMF